MGSSLFKCYVDALPIGFDIAQIDHMGSEIWNWQTYLNGLVFIGKICSKPMEFSHGIFPLEFSGKMSHQSIEISECQVQSGMWWWLPWDFGGTRVPVGLINTYHPSSDRTATPVEYEPTYKLNMSLVSGSWSLKTSHTWMNWLHEQVAKNTSMLVFVQRYSVFMKTPVSAGIKDPS